MLPHQRTEMTLEKTANHIKVTRPSGCNLKHWKM